MTSCWKPRGSESPTYEYEPQRKCRTSAQVRFGGEGASGSIIRITKSVSLPVKYGCAAKEGGLEVAMGLERNSEEGMYYFERGIGLGLRLSCRRLLVREFLAGRKVKCQARFQSY